jgi:CBS domain-containing protein
MYEFLEETVQKNMTNRPKTVAPETTIGDLLRLFNGEGAEAFPVVSNQKLVGIVSKADALKAFGLLPDSVVPHYDDMLGTTVGEVMTRNVMTIDAATPLQRVLYLMVSHHFKTMPVVDANNNLQGVISRDDLIAALIRCTGHRGLPLAQPGASYYSIA